MLYANVIAQVLPKSILIDKTIDPSMLEKLIKHVEQAMLCASWQSRTQLHSIAISIDFRISFSLHSQPKLI
jgi:phage baseplate assembly protein W